jgi:hypothetical protein
MDPVPVSLVVVTCQSAPVLGPLLESAAASSAALADTIFVDNASTDGTCELIARRLPGATIVANTENRGFAAAVNQGVDRATTERVLLANPDTAWTVEDLRALSAFLDTRPRAAAVCPRLVFPDDAPQASVRRFPTHANIWFSRHSPLRGVRLGAGSRAAYTLDDPAEPQIVEAVAATFMLLRRDAYRAVGGMDEGYFLYVEDTDLCKRWRDAGSEVWIDPRVAVRHHWQGGSRRDPTLRIHHRNGIRRYFRKHHPECRLANGLLFAVFGLLDWKDRLTGTAPARGRS